MTRDVRFILLPAVLIGAFVTWMVLESPSDAGGEPLPLRSPNVMTAQNTSWFNPVITPTEATGAMPVQIPPPEAALVQTAPVDGLKISSQSWRRGGLGSKALVTFTLRNRNDYPVRDIEIACAFARKDGSHLTDRRRTIHDIVNTRSQRVFTRMLVGFVNVSANQAKCSVVTATRI